MVLIAFSRDVFSAVFALSESAFHNCHPQKYKLLRVNAETCFHLSSAECIEAVLSRLLFGYIYNHVAEGDGSNATIPMLGRARKPDFRIAVHSRCTGGSARRTTSQRALHEIRISYPYARWRATLHSHLHAERQVANLSFFADAHALQRRAVWR